MPTRAAVHHVINSAREQLDMSEHDLWVAYRAQGGSASQQAISAFLRGTTILSEQDLNHLAVALNERFIGEPVELSARRAEVAEDD